MASHVPLPGAFVVNFSQNSSMASWGVFCLILLGMIRSAVRGPVFMERRPRSRDSSRSRYVVSVSEGGGGGASNDMMG